MIVSAAWTRTSASCAAEKSTCFIMGVAEFVPHGTGRFTSAGCCPDPCRVSTRPTAPPFPRHENPSQTFPLAKCLSPRSSVPLVGPAWAMVCFPGTGAANPIGAGDPERTTVVCVGAADGAALDAEACDEEGAGEAVPLSVPVLQAAVSRMASTASVFFTAPPNMAAGPGHQDKYASAQVVVPCAHSRYRSKELPTARWRNTSPGSRSALHRRTGMEQPDAPPRGAGNCPADPVGPVAGRQPHAARRVAACGRHAPRPPDRGLT